MEPEKSLPDEGSLTTCTWCGAALGQNAMPPQSAMLFCSRRCEIEGSFWLFQELCVIEIIHPPHQSGGQRDIL